MKTKHFLVYYYETLNLNHSAYSPLFNGGIFIRSLTPKGQPMRQLKLSGLAICFFLSQPLLADTLMLDSISAEPENSKEGLLRPARGMTAQQVFNKFGKPLEEKAAIGTPPITRWIYSDFKVYFEYDHVIRSVITRKGNN